MCGSDSSLQTTFSTHLMIICCDLRHSVKSRNCQDLMLLDANFWGKGPQISGRILKIWYIVEHIAKFGDDQPSHLKIR